MAGIVGDSGGLAEGAGQGDSLTLPKPKDVIRNDEQYRLVREQLCRMERALASLEREIRPRSEERFRLVAESYEDMIDKLEGQLREYEEAVAKGT